ncbi:Na-translocating system protein MpsC family protein [Paenibacillus bovis]|uniref:Na+-translocating membrane potential-generating system MpsC domain-containing protein n=1 Tax=Paenibacillus bovis TaxID=1616788 RepID=A0A172ZEZ6_9BACL|nr:Na-translocating system protein MpsC family protein [Paenibacillus bovis]ANF95730.1 hypothetical protein AR543_06760 [Paenibacillus bovis]
MKYRQFISQATSFTTKLLRNRFGKGPQSVNIALNDQCIIFHLREFISPVENFLLSQEEEEAFRYTRELIMKSMLPELRSFLQEHLEMEITDMYYDWGMHNASGIIVGLLEAGWKDTLDYEGREAVHAQIIEVTRHVQKAPEIITSWWVNPKTLVVFRQGIIILIEKELIDLGLGSLLKTAKRRLEKRMLLQAVQLDTVLGKSVADLYVDWNFDQDHSVIVYIFE